MRLAVDPEAVAAVCRRHGIRRLAVFGSVLREDFTPDSDLDVLVEFEPEARVGLRFIDIQDELSALFCRRVDLNTPAFLGRHLRQQVLDTAQVLYDRQG